MSWSLRPKQLEQLSFYMQWKGSETPICMDLSDPGTGKTPPVCLNQYRRATEGLRTVWVMPKSLIGKNYDELLRFSNFQPKHIANLQQKSPAKVQEEYLKSTAAVYLVNGTQFTNMQQQGAFAGIDAIDVDEIHMLFKGGSSGRTAAFHQVALGAAEGVLMTGTLLDGGLNPAWPTIHAVEPRYYPLGHKDFKAQHELKDIYGKFSGWTGHAKIGRILAHHAIRKTRKEVFGDIPENEYIPVTFWTEMTEMQKALHDQFVEEAWIELEEFFISGRQPGAAYHITRSILDHPNQVIHEGQVLDLLQGQESGKERAIRAKIAEHVANNKPFILFSTLIQQQKRLLQIAREEGAKVGFMDGSTSGHERSRLDKEFRAGNLLGIIASNAVATVGWNWQFWGDSKVELEWVYFASLPYLDSHYSQGLSRAIREARRQNLMVGTFAHPGTNDTRLMHKLIYKSMQANAVDPTYEVVRFDTDEPT